MTTEEVLGWGLLALTAIALTGYGLALYLTV